jgi:predicted SAM-dependent methyltransferase
LRIMFYAGCDDVLSLENWHRKLNEDGKVWVAAPDWKVIIPTEYDDVLSLENWHRKLKKDGKVWVAAPDWKVIIPTEYDDVLPLKNWHRKLKKDGKAWVAAPDWKVIIPTEYDGESFFDMKNWNLPYVEKRLRWIMSVAWVLHKAEYSSYPNLLDNWYAVVENYSDITHNTKWLLDDKWNLVIPLSFSMITLDPDGLVSVRYCVNDKESHWTLQLYWWRLVTVYESIKEKYWKYTLHGDKIIPCVCDSILEDTGSKWTYIVRIGRGDCLIKNDGSVIFDSNEYFKSRKNFRHETYNINKFIESGKWEPKIATISICRGENVSYWLINEKWEVLIYPKYASELQYHDKDLYLTTKKEWSRLWWKIIEIYVSCLDGKEYIKN